MHLKDGDRVEMDLIFTDEKHMVYEPIQVQLTLVKNNQSKEDFVEVYRNRVSAKVMAVPNHTYSADSLSGVLTAVERVLNEKLFAWTNLGFMNSTSD